MTKEVLVLCQRKSGKSSYNGYGGNVEDIVVPKINKLVQQHLGSDTTIKYLTDMRHYEGDADYKFTLKSDNLEAKEFISAHKKFYSFIILNTSPIRYMDFNLIYDLLEPEGMIYFSRFPIDTPVDISRHPEEKINNIKSLFCDIGGGLYRKNEWL